jgi:hypothetical protein
MVQKETGDEVLDWIYLGACILSDVPSVSIER